MSTDPEASGSESQAFRTRTEVERFGTLLDHAEALRARGLPFDELGELARLYRRAATRLARMRERNDDPAAIRYLNALCVRAYAHLDVAPRPSADQRLAARLPIVLARTAWAQALAWLLLVVGVYAGAGLVAADPAAVHALIPHGLGYGPDTLDRLLVSPELRAEFFEREPADSGTKLVFGSALFAHNTRVGLFSFASGMLAGVPTLLLAVYNGLVLGAFGAVFWQPPARVEFLAWILPHGIPEFTAISLCVAAGLLLGRAVAAPGLRGHRVAIREAGESAALLVIASLPLFVLAAAIESFVRESALGTAPRFGVAGAMLAMLVSIALLTRRAARRRRGDASWLAELGLAAADGRDQRSAP